jgi:hypothetical protein
MIWLLYGSTGEAEISWFQGLFAGKMVMFSTSDICALQTGVASLTTEPILTGAGLLLSLLLQPQTAIKNTTTKESSLFFIEKSLRWILTEETGGVSLYVKLANRLRNHPKKIKIA